MPQVFHQQIAPQTQLVLWHIAEPESFFSAAARGIRPIAHPHKRLQHLCGRYLLQLLVPSFPLEQIVAEHNNKPFIPNHPYHFSISHCDNYVAAILSTTHRVGVDVETISPKAVSIRHKFLTMDEEALLKNYFPLLTESQKLTLAWSAKEAMFKWLGEVGIDFRKHLVLQKIYYSKQDQILNAQIRKNTPQDVEINFKMGEEIVLTWLAN